MEILIAEDDYISRNLLKKVLIEMGHDVVEAENGHQAWQLLQKTPFKIVISDWMMPEMDGLELCKKIRNSAQKGYVYIIMLTARDRKTDLVDVFKAGADDYIPKPFDPEELRARVLTGERVVHLEEGHNALAHTLIESRNKLRIVLDSLTEEIVSLDRDMNIVSANQAFVDYAGFDMETVVGKAMFDDTTHTNPIVCKDDIQTLVEQVFASGQSKTKLLSGKDRNGKESIRQLSCLAIVNEDEQVIQTVVVTKDITEERKKTEEIKSLNGQLMETSAQIEAKNKKLESTLKRLEETQAHMLQSEKMASIGQLAAGVAHEINNPTGFVSSNLKTLSDYQKDLAELIGKYHGLIGELKTEGNGNTLPEKIHTNIENIMGFEKDIDVEFLLEDIVDLIGDCREGTDRIKKIVIDLKDFAHPGEEVVQSTDINNGLDSTLNVVNNELKYKATVHKDFGKIPTVKGVPQQLNQVFMNILVNAAQAIEKKGDIHIKTWAADQDVKITISDTGCGIPEENLKKIFDPFFTTKEIGKGTGLGMNIVYNIIQKHQGTIEVQSEIGKGTTFTISLPADLEG